MRPGLRNRLTQRRTHLELDPMTLAVVESERLDMGEVLERPGQTGGGILAPRKEHEGVV